MPIPRAGLKSRVWLQEASEEPRVKPTWTWEVLAEAAYLAYNAT